LGDPAPDYLVDRGRIRLADDVFVYLERTLAPPGPLAPEIALRPYGVAPTEALPSGRVVAAVGPGEAVWLGFQSVDGARAAIVRVRVDGPEPLDAVTGGPWEDALSDNPRNHLVCPPDYRLAGVRRDDGYVPFGVGEPDTESVLERLSCLSYGEAPAVVPLELVTLERFTTLTGIPAEPLDPEKAYKGWRLP
jgi:hypothetical protein